MKSYHLVFKLQQLYYLSFRAQQQGSTDEKQKEEVIKKCLLLLKAFFLLCYYGDTDYTSSKAYLNNVFVYYLFYY